MAAPEPTWQLSKALGDCRILIVDDARSNVDILVKALSDYKLSVALSGAEALELIAHQAPDLILLDIIMPGMDGIETARRILDSSSESIIPIIFITARDHPDDVAEGLAIGAVDYVTKPFHLAEIKARVRTHLSLKVAQDTLKQQNNILEQKVQQRTANLMAANENLELQIKERKLLQEQLIRSECLATSGRLAASVAHEINSPLQGVSAIIGLIRSKYAEDRALLQNINLVENAFERIRVTARRLLDLNRPRLESKQKLDLHRVLRDTCALLNSYLRRRKIAFELALASDAAVVEASAQQMGQVFMNLINNAAEALGDIKDRQPVDKPCITIKSSFDMPHIVIEVADNGPGIPAADREHIFDLFFSNRKESGMGVGLSICRSIIEEHGGRLAVVDRPQPGVTFAITLPLAR